ncbi:MAG: acetylxylan esterase [bacterium]|nr:acetylxylan esterase [bacterium]
MKVSFDECFQTFPPISAPADLDRYWNKALLQLKKAPVDPRARLLISKSLGRESRSEVSFAAHDKTRIEGILSVPRTRGKVPAIISFHDYHDPHPDLDRSSRQEGLAHLSVYLRNHGPDSPGAGDAPGATGNETGGRTTTAAGSRVPAGVAGTGGATGAPKLPSLFRQHGLDPIEDSYVFSCYLDAVRCVDFLRLQKGIDASRIGLIGRGFGAAQAVFAAALMKDNVAALVLDRPGFLWFGAWLEDSISDLAGEMGSILGNVSPRKKGRLKKNLAYLEPLNWSESLEQPVLAAIGLEDEINPPRAAFGFFNHLKTDKSMEIYPDETTDPEGREQFKKSLRFLAEHLQKK